MSCTQNRLEIPDGNPNWRRSDELQIEFSEPPHISSAVSVSSTIADKSNTTFFRKLKLMKKSFPLVSESGREHFI